MPISVQASDFRRNFASFQRQAQRDAIEVKNHQETTGYFISPEDYATYRRLLSETRVAVTPAELPPHLRQAIAEAQATAPISRTE